MKRSVLVVALLLAVAAFAPAWGSGQEPVKWSAPMDQYPSNWKPSTPPPNFTPEGYQQYPYDPNAYNGQARQGAPGTWTDPRYYGEYGGYYQGYGPGGAYGPYGRYYAPQRRGPNRGRFSGNPFLNSYQLPAH
jgi:hypothetical protein